MDRFQPCSVHLRIALRRHDVGVPQEFLHGAQIRPARQQMRRERVAQRVRADAFGEPGCRGIPLHQLPHPLARQAAARSVDKHGLRLRPPAHEPRTHRLEIPPQRRLRTLSQGNEPFFVPLA